MSNLQLRAFREPWRFRDDIRVTARIRSETPGLVTILTKAEFTSFDPGAGPVPEEESFHLSEAEAQALMDSLWVAGLRPSEGSGSAGALAAVQKNLEDMRIAKVEWRAFAYGLLEKLP